MHEILFSLIYYFDENNNSKWGWSGGDQRRKEDKLNRGDRMHLANWDMFLFLMILFGKPQHGNIQNIYEYTRDWHSLFCDRFNMTWYATTSSPTPTMILTPTARPRVEEEDGLPLARQLRIIKWVIGKSGDYYSRNKFNLVQGINNRTFPIWTGSGYTRILRNDE